jgi:porin
MSLTRLPALTALCALLMIQGGRALAQETGNPPPAAPQDPAAMLANAIKPLGDNGVTLQAIYTGEVLGNLSGGYARGADYEGLITLSLKLDLQKIAHWEGATFYVSGLYPHGAGITARYVHDYNTVSSLDAFDSPRVFELWLQQALFDGKFSIRVGSLTTDNDFFLSTNAALFVNSGFGTMSFTAHDLALPTYPVASEGIRLHADLTPDFYIQGLVVDDNPGFENTNNLHGARFGFQSSHGVLTVMEAGHSPPQPANAKGPGPTYKVGGFYDTQFHPDIEAPTDSHGTYGFYAIADQPLYTAPGSTADVPLGLSGFARFGFAPDERNPVVYYFDTGLDYTGLIPGRSKDILGAAFSFERLGADVTLSSGAPVLEHHEHVLEVTYLATLTDSLSIQPDFQYVINPGGFGKAPNAVVAGVRFNVTF